MIIIQFPQIQNALKQFVVLPNDILLILNIFHMLSSRIVNITTKLFSSERINYLALGSKDRQQFLKTLQTNHRVDYKKYPYAAHQDPKSPEYTPHQFDDYHDEMEVKAYNQVIDNFNNDLKIQRQVWEAINNLDRPYKRGIPGVDTNLDPNGLAKPDLPDLGFPRHDPLNQFPHTFANQDRFIANTPFHYNIKFQRIKEWQQQRRNRPVTRDFNDKGYKYDVAVKPEEKFQYVADRLGHPEFVGRPIEWLFKLSGDIYHPVYVDQPFVQKPSPKPHSSLNFQQGEVLYQNTKIAQWIKFWQLTALTAGGFAGIFVPYNLGFKTNLVTDAADDLIHMQYHLVSPGTIDILRLTIPIVAGASYYVVYALMNFSNAVLNDYVVKMSYSKDKELLFVKRLDLHGLVKEEVYEMAHLEILPPAHKAGVSTLSSQDEDGLWRITCLNTQKTMLAYNNPKNWNLNLRDQFFKQTLGMWDKEYYGFTRDQAAQNQMKWREQAMNSIVQQALPKK